jgi:hypothetical protein
MKIRKTVELELLILPFPHTDEINSMESQGFLVPQSFVFLAKM